ncbi:MAG: VOC family protein [Pseudomonadota bacterium]
MRVLLSSCILLGLVVFSPAHGDNPRLDHVVLAVHDLQTSNQIFKKYGFTVKDGKVHNNGLINSFVEFSDGTEIELMSVLGTSNDPLAQIYSKFLASSEGGIFVALSGFDINNASKQLRSESIDHHVQPGRLWNYLTFPTGSGLEHIFLIENHKKDTSTQTATSHRNGVSGINEVWLGSSEKVENLLRALKISSHSNDRIYPLSNATLRLENQTQIGSRPRFHGIVLSLSSNHRFSKVQTHGIWIK